MPEQRREGSSTLQELPQAISDLESAALFLQAALDMSSYDPDKRKVVKDARARLRAALARTEAWPRATDAPDRRAADALDEALG